MSYKTLKINLFFTLLYIIIVSKEVRNLNSNIQNWDLSTSFFEWGIKCPELSTESTQVSGVSPITAVSFAWNTVQPEITASLTANTTKRTYGVGQCKFEMLGSNSRCKVQDAFKAQTSLPTVEIIRFTNVGGQPAEAEKYVFTNVLITSYGVTTDNVAGGHRDLLSINSTGDHKYVQMVRDDTGKAMGQLVSQSA